MGLEEGEEEIKDNSDFELGEPDATAAEEEAEGGPLLPEDQESLASAGCT